MLYCQVPVIYNIKVLRVWIYTLLVSQFLEHSKQSKINIYIPTVDESLHT